MPEPGAGHRARTARVGEHGFGVLELVIIMAIIAILMAILVLSGRGAKQSAHFKSAAGAAIMYSEAIESYMADNGQTPPVMGNATQWPDAARGPVDRMVNGPDGRPKPYLKSTPEAITNGSVAFGSAAGNAQATITYTISGGTYQLRVAAVDDPSRQCVVTNGPPVSGVQSCS